MNLTAPMLPTTATMENHAAMVRCSTCITRRSLAFLGILPALRKAKAGKTKSKGVNPIAPQMDTKSPKKGIEAKASLHKQFRRRTLSLETLDRIRSLKYAYVSLQYIHRWQSQKWST
ncbi:hypothetical protein BHM03_00054999 [Ensete ventricosum]|nr:hypothetical protein BHM03_00054999 [Ensete ventricosum]